MTQREEEIFNAANEYVTKTHSPSTNEFQTAMNIAVLKAYIAAAEWSDTTMIDKACEWLRRNMYEGTCEQISSKKPYPFMKDFIEEFKQVMKGE